MRLIERDGRLLEGLCLRREDKRVSERVIEKEVCEGISREKECYKERLREICCIVKLLLSLPTIITH